jgi:hypothetical protein
LHQRKYSSGRLPRHLEVETASRSNREKSRRSIILIP